MRQKGTANMKFLVTTKSKYMMPPEAGPGLMAALSAWAKKYTDNGKMEAVWSSAGTDGGGGIFNVESIEELDAIMTEFPIAPFSEVKVTPITDLHASLERLMKAMQARAGG